MYRLSFGMIIPSIEEALHISKVLAGSLFSITSLATAVSTLLAGGFMARLNIKNTYLLGMILLCLGMALVPTALSYLVLAVYLIIAGFGAGLLVPALYTILGEYKAGSRALMLGIANSTFSIGGFIGPWLAAQLIIVYGWASPFFAFALIGFLIIAISWFSTSPSHIMRSENKALGGYGQVIHIRNLIKLLISIMISNFAFFSIVTWTPTSLIEFQGLDVYTTGFTFGLFSFSGALGSIILGRISDKIGRRNRLAFIAALASGLISVLLYTVKYDFIYIMTLMAVFGFTFYPFWNLQMAMAQESVRPEYVGTATGLIYGASFIGSVLSPALVGMLIESIGIIPSMLYGVSMPIVLYSLVILMVNI
jgi:predicted MFS family arabinose efflux permease